VRIGPGTQLPLLRPLNLPPPQQQHIQMQGHMRVQGVRMPMHRPPPPLTPANSMYVTLSSKFGITQ
jgi:hypothetical protein